MSQAISDAKVQETTGKSWKEWFDILETAGARDLAHKEIATWLRDEHGVDGWWAQGLTVRYEQEIGRREPGQESDGSFTANASKTIEGTPKEVLEWWLQKVTDLPEINGQTLVNSDTSATEKWRYWRAQLSDNSRVIVTIGEKAPKKSTLGIGHEKLPTKEAADEWKEFWKKFLAGDE